MKKYLMYCVACVLLFAGCHDDENELLDNNGFPKVTEHNLDAFALIKEFFSHKGGEYPAQNQAYQEWEEDSYKTTFTCFHSLAEVEASEYVTGIDNLPSIDWQTQTLVICRVYSRYVIHDESFVFEVYNHSGKYTINVTMYEGDFNLAAVDNIGVAIVLARKDIKNGDVKLILNSQRIKME